jgi:hypothetical protein
MPPHGVASFSCVLHGAAAVSLDTYASTPKIVRWASPAEIIGPALCPMFTIRAAPKSHAPFA